MQPTLHWVVTPTIPNGEATKKSLGTRRRDWADPLPLSGSEQLLDLALGETQRDQLVGGNDTVTVLGQLVGGLVEHRDDDGSPWRSP